MRISFNGLERPKAAAKLITRSSGQVKLAQAQDVIARATGYRDWHELAKVTRGSPEPLLTMQDRGVVILSLADELDLNIGEAHYLISRSRLLGTSDLSLLDMLDLRAWLWRARLFGPSQRGKPGTVIRVRGDRTKQPAYLKSAGRPTHVLYDHGLGIIADFEMITPRITPQDFVPSRLWLPYGFWTLRDGSSVTFSRDYKPMWRIANGVVERMAPWVWVKGITVEKHFATSDSANWSSGLARGLAINYLERHRLFDPPLLLDAMPLLFDNDVNSIGGAVEVMRHRYEAAD